MRAGNTRAARTAVATALAIVLAATLTGCGDDGDADDGATGEAPGAETTAPDQPDEPDGPDGSDEGRCAGTDLAFTNLTTGTSVEVTDTAAVSLADGAAYTAYLADFTIDRSELTAFSAPTVAEGANMVTFFITTYNAEETPPPIEAGTVIEYSPDFGVLTFSVIHVAGAESFGGSDEASGTATVTAVGDTLCVEVDYADAEKTLTGTFEAEVRAV